MSVPTGAPVRVERFAALLDRARALATGRRRAVLGIAGSPGAGKTTLALAVRDALAAAPPPGLGPEWVAHVPMDGFHLADVELDRLGRRGRKGAPDTFDSPGYAALLHRIRQVPADGDPPVYAPAFDREIEQPVAGSIPVHPECRLVVSEGNYLLLDEGPWRVVRAALDEVWYVEVDDSLRRARLVHRHVRFGKPPDAAQRWVEVTDEPNAVLVAAHRSAADVVVAGAGLALPPG